MSRLFIGANSSLFSIYKENKTINESDRCLLLPIISGYKFKYPSELSYDDFPYINKEPFYKINLDNDLFFMGVYKYKGEKRIRTDENDITNYFNLLKENKENKLSLEKNKVVEYLNTFDEIIIPSIIDYRFSRIINLFFKDLFLDDNINLKIKTQNFIETNDEFKTTNLDLDNINYLNGINTYKNKDFFDYNFNINSLMLFNSFFDNNFVLTNFSLNVLRLVSDNIDINLLKMKILKNKIGSSISIPEIINNLSKQNLLKIKNDKVFLSLKGKEFLERIHPKIRSIDSKVLFNDINKMEHNNFKDKYGKKLKVYFKKQRNYLNK